MEQISKARLVELVDYLNRYINDKCEGWYELYIANRKYGLNFSGPVDRESIVFHPTTRTDLHTQIQAYIQGIQSGRRMRKIKNGMQVIDLFGDLCRWCFEYVHPLDRRWYGEDVHLLPTGEETGELRSTKGELLSGDINVLLSGWLCTSCKAAEKAAECQCLSWRGQTCECQCASCKAAEKAAEGDSND